MNIQNLIKKPYRFLRYVPLMLAGMSLASCSFFGLKDPFSDERPAQVVSGPRHAPILNPDTVPPVPDMHGYVHSTVPPQDQPTREGINPKYYDNSKMFTPPMPEPAPVVAPTVPSAIPAVAKSSREMDPYDYYDNSSNAIEEEKPQEIKPQNNEEIRKPLPGNPNSVLGPQSSIPPAHLIVLAQAEQTSDPADDEEASESNSTTQAHAKPSWLDRKFQKFSGSNNPARSLPTPPLSSVPPTPEQFQTIKNDRLSNMQDLQGDRIEALQEKQQLDSEPSQLPPPANIVQHMPVADNASVPQQTITPPVPPAQ